MLDYLGRYTHRVAIANHRILDVAEGKVTFRWRDYRRGKGLRTMTLSAEEFIRRFLLHVLPDRLVRIRHFGFLANRHRTEKIERARQLLHAESDQHEATADLGKEALEKSLSVTELRLCPACGQGRLICVEVLPTASRQTSNLEGIDSS